MDSRQRQLPKCRSSVHLTNVTGSHHIPVVDVLLIFRTGASQCQGIDFLMTNLTNGEGGGRSGQAGRNGCKPEGTRQSRYEEDAS